MNSPFPVIVPLINPNEAEALLAGMHVAEGQWAEKDAVLCTLETTKSTAEVVAERAGFVRNIRFSTGESVQAGELLLWLTDDLTQPLPDAAPTRAANKIEATTEGSTLPQDSDLPLGSTLPSESTLPPPGVRLTHPALALATRHALNLEKLPTGRLITEKDIQRLIEQEAQKDIDWEQILPPVLEPNAVILYGGGGHAKMLIDLIKGAGKLDLVGILDDGLSPGTQIMGVPVLGGGDLLPRLMERGLIQVVNAVGGIGNIGARVAVFHKLQSAGCELPAVVHASAVIEPGVRLAPGAQVFARAYLGGDVQVGFGAIVSSGAIVSHDCRIEEFAIVSPGAILAGEVTIGARTLVGMGTTINLRVTVSAGARLGNNATVNVDVPAGGVVQAGTVWPVSVIKS